jgi:transaldolase
MLSPKTGLSLDLISKNIDIFADVKSTSEIINFRESSFVKGFTTNPTLIKKGGATNYLDFVRESVDLVGDLNISIEVIADEFEEMYIQAIKLSKLSNKVFVKIPIYNSRHESSIPLIANLIKEGCPLNITALLTPKQIDNLASVVNSTSNLIVSIFAGRIADTGIDPIPTILHSTKVFSNYPNIKTLWASPREILNVIQAIDCNCDIITIIPEILNKFNLIGKDLDQYSLETVQMFYNDAVESKFTL